MSNQWNLDERQLWQRGNVFKHVLIYFIVALAAEAVCQNLELRWEALPYVGGNISSGISGPWARGKTVFFWSWVYAGPVFCFYLLVL